MSNTGVNKVILIGNVGKDPEIRYTQNGTAVTNFTLATNETWTKDGKKEERVEWHNVVAWARLAEICGQYLTTGKQVFIEGRIQTRKWEDRDGGTRYTTEVVAQNMQMLGGQIRKGEQPVESTVGSPEPDADIPF